MRQQGPSSPEKPSQGSEAHVVVDMWCEIGNTTYSQHGMHQDRSKCSEAVDRPISSAQLPPSGTDEHNAGVHHSVNASQSVAETERRSNMKLTILYRDDECVVVDKPWDIAINTMDPVAHPVTVATLLRAALPDAVDHTCVHHFRFVHRLDFSTSGVLCVALTKRAAAKLSGAFERRNTEKTYLALLRGQLGHLAAEGKGRTEGEGEHGVTRVEVPIGEDSRASHKMLPVTDPYCRRNTVRDAVTEFVPVEYGTLGGVEVTKARIRLLTGRRHQIRVHALAIGHPVLGDATYTGDTESPRMFLHAKSLRVHHLQDDDDDRELFVESPLDFRLDKAAAATATS